MARDVPTVTVENAQLLFRNFAGRADPFNREGDRNFCVILKPEDAVALANEGWNVKWLEAREEGDERTPYIKVTVKFDKYPPRITMISSAGRTTLGANEVNVLDYTDIKQADLIFSAYDWEMPSGKSGRAAYLKTMFVTIEEDDLERKYARIGRDEGE